MKWLFPIFLCLLLAACTEPATDSVIETDSLALPIDASELSQDTVAAFNPKVLVLPPYDEVANGGFSPDVQEWLENCLRNRPEVELIPFPYKTLMGVPYQQVFDKKFCAEILEVVDADFILMSKLELESGLELPRRWKFALRFYDTQTDRQFNWDLYGNGLNPEELEALIGNNCERIAREFMPG